MTEEKKQENIDQELNDSDNSDDNTAKSHGEILKEQICEGQEIYKRSKSSIFLSSLAAGLEIGFSFLLICTVISFFTGKVAEDTLFKLIAFVYPVGFVMVVLGQSILFTEQTSLLTLPVLNKKRSLRSLVILWGNVILGNLLGGILIAFVLIWLGPKLDIFDKETIAKIGEHVVKPHWTVIFISSILAGWLMGLLSWLITSSKDSISRILIIFLITGIIGFTGLHHSIIGNIEVFAGLITSSKITLSTYLSFEFWALIGNALGGVIFVAILKYRAFVYNVEGY